MSQQPEQAQPTHCIHDKVGCPICWPGPTEERPQHKMDWLAAPDSGPPACICTDGVNHADCLHPRHRAPAQPTSARELEPHQWAASVNEGIGWPERKVKLYAEYLAAHRITALEQENARLREIEQRFDDQLYCEACGSCGIADCCSPEQCKKFRCEHGESLEHSYKEVSDDWDAAETRAEAAEQRITQLLGLLREARPWVELSKEALIARYNKPNFAPWADLMLRITEEAESND